MAKNEYLNQAAAIFKVVCAEEAASLNVVEVLTHMMHCVDKIGKNIFLNAQNSVLNFFSILQIKILYRIPC